MLIVYSAARAVECAVRHTCMLIVYSAARAVECAVRHTCTVDSYAQERGAQELPGWKSKNAPAWI